MPTRWVAIVAVAFGVACAGLVSCSGTSPSTSNASAGQGGENTIPNGDSTAQGGGAAGGEATSDGGSFASAGATGQQSEGGTAGAAGSADGGDGGVTGNDAEPVPSADEVCRQTVAAYCQRLDECFQGKATCFAQAELCPSFLFGPGSSMTPAGVHACMGELRDWSCVDIQARVPPPCLQPGLRAGGEQCAFASQCASEECVGGAQQCGTCTTQQRELGEVCGGFLEHECVAGTFCSESGKCQAIASVVHAGEGEPCDIWNTPTISCTGDLYCYFDGEKSDYFCTRRGLEGELCGFDDVAIVEKVPCAYGLDCAIDYEADPTATLGTCRQPRDCGDVTCDEGYYCDRIPNWQCEPLPGLGQPCVQQSRPYCAPGLICTVQPVYASTGTCLPPRAGFGDECDVYCNLWQRCESDHCTYLDAASCGP